MKKLRRLMAFLLMITLLASERPVFAAGEEGEPVSGDTPAAEEALPDIDECTYDPSTQTLYLGGVMQPDKTEDANTAAAALARAGVSKNDVKHVAACDGTVLPSNSGSLFSGYKMMESVDLSLADSSSVTDMRMLFAGCESLKKLNLSVLDTTNVDRSNGYLRMLTDCKSLEEVTFGGKFNTAGAQKLTSFFSGCEALKTVDFDHFSTSGAWDISHMFNGCKSLATLDTTKMSIASVDGRGMAGLFTGCESLTELDLSNWYTSSISIMANLFSGCSSLKTIYVGEGWRVGQVSESQNMFSGCESLVGGMGTVFDPKFTDKRYGSIDQGEVSPGYMTRKGEAPEKTELTTVVVRCDATIKMDDGSYYRTYSYTGEPVVPKEIWVYERFSGYSSYKFMEASDYYLRITDNVEPGNGKITAYPTEHGRYVFEPVTLEFPINKAKKYSGKGADIQAPCGKEDSFDIGDMIEAGGESGSVKISDSNGIFDGEPALKGTKLAYRIRDDQSLIGKRASVSIPVSESDHYLAYEIELAFIVVKPPSVPVESVSLNRSELSLSINESFQLQASVLPANATNKDILWYCGSNRVVRVDETGLVTAVGEGTETVYAAAKDNTGIVAKCSVRVTDPSKKTSPTPTTKPEPKPSGVPTPTDRPAPTPIPTPSAPIPGGEGPADPQPALTREKEQSITLVKGQKFQLADTAWKSDDKRSVSVSGKTVTAKKEGSTTLRRGTGEDEYVIHVKVVAPVIAKKDRKLKLDVGANAQLSFSGLTAEDGKLSFPGGTELDVLFYSAKPAVAEVDADGYVMAVSGGSTQVTALINGVSFKWTIKVKENAANASASKVRSLHLNVGKNGKVKIPGLKEKWQIVTGGDVVSVNGNKIHTDAAGTATLRAGDYTLLVYVDDPSIIGSSKPYKMKLNMAAGSEHPIELAGLNSSVLFRSSKCSVAFVGTDGIIRARGKGTAKISAKINGKTVTINVTVN